MPEVVDDPQTPRHNRTDTDISLQRLRHKNTRPAQIQSRQNSSKKKGKGT